MTGHRATSRRSAPAGRFSWVFDLDNTLHDASPQIFPHINRAMTDWIRRELGLDEAAASDLRNHYWRRYGATLLGLMRHHAVKPANFLWDTHQFDDLGRMVTGASRLRMILRRLPGRKFVFSNAPAHYSRAVLRALDVADVFDDVFSIERTAYRPKPDSAGFLRLARANRLRLTRCIMIEDTLENLRTAKRLGMRTVWVSREARAPGYVDAVVEDVAELPRLVLRLS